MVIGAPLASNFFYTLGRAYVFMGGSPMDPRSPFVIEGPSPNTQFGGEVSGGGDHNGDGIPDLVVGAPNDGSVNGRAYVFYGPTFPSNASQGLLLDPGGSFFGRAIASDGDVDGDRVDDILIGLPGDRRAFLFLGRTGGMDTAIDVVLTSNGALAAEYGSAVFLADVTADGLADYMVADDRDSGLGLVNTYFAPSLTGAVDFQVAGRSGNVLFGYSVAAGDINGNGFFDYVIADPAWGQQQGRVYIYFGGSPPNTGIDLTFTGENAGDFYGGSVF